MMVLNEGIVDRLDAAILCNPHLRGRRLHVVSDAGHVVLEGKVGSYYQKQMAQEAIRRIEGVRGIDNRLEVMTS
jgi:osmotically-inducible protein OsmY